MVAHRVVHGGMRFTAPVRIDEKVIAEIHELSELATCTSEGARVDRGRTPSAAARSCRWRCSIRRFSARFRRRPSTLCRLVSASRSRGAALWFSRPRAQRCGVAGASYTRRCVGAADSSPCNLVVAVSSPRTITAAGRQLDGILATEGLVMATRSGTSIRRFCRIRRSDWVVERTARGLLDTGSQSRVFPARTGTHPSCWLIRHRRRSSRWSCIAIACGSTSGAFCAVLGGCGWDRFRRAALGNICRRSVSGPRGMEWAGIELDAAAVGAARGSGSGHPCRPGARCGCRWIPVDEEVVMVRGAAGSSG